MPGPQEIEIIIKPDGTVEESVRGVSGPECEAVTKAIEDALGEIDKREHTSDYYGQTTETGDHVTTNV